MTPITPADIEASILMEVYQNSGNEIDDWTTSTYKSGVSHEDFAMASKALSFLTICVLVLRNGHTVTGESHCQEPAKFDAQIGRDEARKAAIKNLWPMVVYAAREKAAVSVAQSLGHQAAEALNAINATPRLIDGAGDPPMHVPV